MRGMTVDSQATAHGVNIETSGYDIERSGAQPGVTLAPRIQLVVDIIGEARTRRLREASARRSPDAEPSPVQP